MLTGVVVVVFVGVVGVDTFFKKLHSSQFAMFLSDFFLQVGGMNVSIYYYFIFSYLPFLLLYSFFSPPFI